MVKNEKGRLGRQTGLLRGYLDLTWEGVGGAARKGATPPSSQAHTFHYYLGAKVTQWRGVLTQRAAAQEKLLSLSPFCPWALFYHNFPDEETEAQKCSVTCPRPHA